MSPSRAASERHAVGPSVLMLAACVVGAAGVSTRDKARQHERGTPPPVGSSAHGGSRTTLGSAKLATCKYVPSHVEAEWFATPAAGKICEIAARESQVQAAKEWLAYVRSHRRAAPPGSLSKWVCPDGQTEYIEPLIGVARHPFAKVTCPSKRHSAAESIEAVSIFNITYLMLANNCSGTTPAAARGEHAFSRSATPRRLLFDMGCSEWGDRSDPRFASHSDVLHQEFGSGYGPSMPLFDRLLARNCLALDHMYGWEAMPMDAKTWWKPVPAAVKPRLSFFNVPVSVPGTPGWTNASVGSEGDFVSRLRREASADDYVAVKLDIDNVPVEKAIMAQIGKPDIARLVDELFFEYHFNFDNLDFGWESQVGGQNHVNDTVDDALHLMQSMRKKGVRAHFWI